MAFGDGRQFTSTLGASIVSMLLLAVAPGFADSKDQLDQDQVLEAVRQGQIRPLTDVLAEVEKTVPGRVIRVEVERKRGRIVYELKIIGNHGRVREIYIDAASLEILKGW